MARYATLEPVEIPGRASPWQLSVPARLSPTGKAQRLFFKTKSEATHHVMTLPEQRSYAGLMESISPAELDEAVRSLELLRPRKIGLLSAVVTFLSDLDRRAASKTLGECFDAYAALRARSKKYAEELRHTRKSISHLLARSIVDVTAQDLEKCLAGLAQSTKDSRVRRLRSVFGWGVRKGWLTANIALQIDIVGARHDEVEIYSPDDVEKLLKAALEHDKALVPFLALCAFCGLRPEREAAHLQWSDVHLDDDKPQVVVRPELSKVRRRRFVDVPQAAIAWIRKSGVQLSGRVCPFSEATLRRKRRDNRTKAGVRLIQDGLRHSYCSAFMADGGDVNKLLLATGHTSASMLFRHYHRTMTAADAVKYWALMPKE
jgi:integrase